MINPKDLDRIVVKTLSEIGVRDFGIVKLIKGTMVYESGLYDLKDGSTRYDPCFGFSMLSYSRIKNLLEHLKFRLIEKKAIEKVTGINIDEWSVERICDAMTSNIQMMVIMTYHYYSSKFKVPPKDDLREAADYYQKYYFDGQYDPDLVDDFINEYLEVFTK